MSKKTRNVISTPAQQKARIADIEKEEAAEAKAREQDKKNKDFVQLSKSGLSPLRGLMRRSSRAAQILLAMVEEMGRHENALQASLESIQEMSGAPQITVRRALKLLIKEKWIEAVVGLEHTYRVNSGVFWMSYGDRKDVSFQATLAIPDGDKAIKVNKKILRKVMPVLAVKTAKKKISKV